MSQNQPYPVVDLFAGCGGLSLGFEMFKSDHGDYLFDVTMGFEIDRTACLVYNSNRRNGQGTSKRPGLCRQIDVADYLNEAEILANYLWHLCKRTSDQDLEDCLTQLGVTELHWTLAQLDQGFSDDLSLLVSLVATGLRSVYPSFQRVLGQTAVLAFFAD